jgi:hypothetical protein
MSKTNIMKLYGLKACVYVVMDSNVGFGKEQIKGMQMTEMAFFGTVER